MNRFCASKTDDSKKSGGFMVFLRIGCEYKYLICTDEVSHAATVALPASNVSFQYIKTSSILTLSLSRWCRQHPPDLSSTDGIILSLVVHSQLPFSHTSRSDARVFSYVWIIDARQLQCCTASSHVSDRPVMSKESICGDVFKTKALKSMKTCYGIPLKPQMYNRHTFPLNQWALKRTHMLRYL